MLFLRDLKGGEGYALVGYVGNLLSATAYLRGFEICQWFV